MLYRAFPHRPGAVPTEEGGPLWVPRERQGVSRHDNPDHYGALYVSRDAVSAVAERIQAFRGQRLTDFDLRHADGSGLALAAIDDSAVPYLVDLDDPRMLVKRELRPSHVATGVRRVTQAIALDLFREGAHGFSWWSVLEASWRNVTLFAERCTDLLRIETEPEPLGVEHPALRAAAGAIGVLLT